MKLFVTGGTGFIGSNFIEHTNRYNIETIGLRRQGSEAPIKFSRKVNWVYGELNSLKTKDLVGCTHFIHFASYGVFDQNNLQNCLTINVIDSLAAVKKAVDAGIKNFIIIGSCFEYGRSALNYVKVPTTAQLIPVNAYGATKAAASLIISSYLESIKVRYKILRLFHVYGNGENQKRFWPSLCKSALDGKDFDMTFGEQIRDFSNVEDVVSIIYENIDYYNSDKKIFNIGSGNIKSLKEFAQFWWDKLNAKGNLNVGAVPYNPNEVMRYIPDIEN